jgi:hypothetical protein
MDKKDTLPVYIVTRTTRGTGKDRPIIQTRPEIRSSLI